MKRKAEIDEIFEAQTKGILDYKKFTYKSSEGQMDIPAYLFAPLEKKGTHAHPLLIWMHGGVHGNLGKRRYTGTAGLMAQNLDIPRMASPPLRME